MNVVRFAACFSALLASTLAPAEESVGTRATYGASLLQAVISNNQAIQSFDVVVEYEYLDSHPDRVLTYDTRTRYIYTSVGHRHLMIQRAVKSTVPVNGDGEATESGHVIATHFSVSEPGWIRDDRGLRSTAVRDLGVQRYILDWPRFDTFGLLYFPFSSADFEATPGWLRFGVASIHHDGEIVADAEAKATFAQRVNDQVVERTWRIDLDTMMPLEHRIRLLADGSEPYLKERAEYTWEKRNGIYVPLTIRGEMGQTHLNRATGKRTRYHQTTDVRLRWNAVNEPIDQSMLSAATYKTVADMNRFIDPSPGPAR